MVPFLSQPVCPGEWQGERDGGTGLTYLCVHASVMWDNYVGLRFSRVLYFANFSPQFFPDILYRICGLLRFVFLENFGDFFYWGYFNTCTFKPLI